MLLDSGPPETIRVVPSDMRRAAAAWDEASDQVKKANPSDRVPEVATALPGGAAARQANDLVAKLDERFKVWCDGATEQGEGLLMAVREYEAADQRSASEGKKHEAAVLSLVTGSGSPTEVTSSSGPAVFNPNAPASDRMAYLDAKLGGREL